MKFNCPHCDQKVEADDSFAGEIVACPKCNQDISLPAVQELGVCPKCNQPLRTADPVICVNCGHRFRKTPVDPEERARRRKLRLRIFGTMLISLPFIALVMALPAIFGFAVVLIIVGTLPGLLMAMLAKLILLRASRRTGVLAVLMVFVLVFVLFFIVKWQWFNHTERSYMIRTVLYEPQKAQEYPADAIREEVVRTALELQARNLPKKERWKSYSKEQIRLSHQFGKAPFPFRWQLRTVLKRMAENFTTTVLWLLGLNAFNLICAYFFAKNRNAFGRITNYYLEWDDELPGDGDSEDDELNQQMEAEYILLLAVVCINALPSGVFYWFCCILCGPPARVSFFTILFTAATLAPAFVCIGKCGSIRGKCFLTACMLFIIGIFILLGVFFA